MPIPGFDKIDGNALAKVTPLLAALPERSTIQVLHDEWCSTYEGQPCDCNPIVNVLPWL